MSARGSGYAVSIPDALLEEVVQRVVERLAPMIEQSSGGWLDTRGAAEYLGITVNALHKLTAADAIPHAQDGPGAKCYFARGDLDAWRRGLTRVGG